MEKKDNVRFGSFRKWMILLIRRYIIRSIFRKSVFMFRKEALNNITIYLMSNVYTFDPFAQLEVPNIVMYLQGTKPSRGHRDE